MKFDAYNIAPGIKKRILELGWKKPTDIQFKSIPNILKGEDLLAIAQTGTGKTAAYVIPLLHRIDLQKKGSRIKGIKCLVMVPTRELAVQINDVFNDIGKYLKIKTFAIFGGVEQDQQIHKLQNEVDILIATPGRMFDLISQGYIRIDRIRTLVVDEADLMLSKGFYKDIRDALRHIPRQRQTLFFSATIDHEIKKLAYSLVVNPIRIQLSPKDPVSKNVSHFVIKIEMDYKRFLLEQFIKDYPESKILVFVRTKVRADRVSKAMKRVGIDTLILHGDVDQKQRLITLQNFKQDLCHVLIATDVSARGIDIPNVHMVINYDLPDEADTYVHRVGRTGRGRSKGLAYTFCSIEEDEKLKAVERYTHNSIEELTITDGEINTLKTFSLSGDLSMEGLAKMVDDLESIGKKKKRKKK